MNYFKILLFSLSFMVTAITFSACGEDTANQGKEYTSAYICPMHCEGSGSEKAGKCPVCKMDYVANEDYKASGVDKDGKSKKGGEHEGHNHGSHEGHDHGSHEGHEH